MSESIIDVVEKILKEVNYKQNPYFTTLHSGEMSKEDFVETQIQFYDAVIFFSRPMAAVAAKIPTPQLRVEIVRNVWEEHGEGESNSVHGVTFLEFLNQLDGVSKEDINQRKLWPEVRIFNTSLSGACVLDHYLVGVGVMGIIERMFSDISGIIGRGIVARGFLPEQHLTHYTTHEKLDIRHSKDFFDVLTPSWDSNPRSRYFIEQGLSMGAVLFNELYRGLCENRHRRWMQDYTDPYTFDECYEI
jgi:pyrroloquinoline quinone (PQQ) biosynthesis protein C